MVALSFLGISPHGMFLLGHSWRFQMFWERFCGFFHFLFSCLKELEKQLLVPSLNGRAGNSLDLQTSLGKLQELEGGRSKVIQESRELSLRSQTGAGGGWIPISWEFRSCKPNSNLSFLHFEITQEIHSGLARCHGLTLSFFGEKFKLNQN